MASVNIIPVSEFQGTVQVSLNKMPISTSKKRSVICTLDKSGSMAGVPLGNAVQGIVNFIQKHLDNLENLFVVTYDVTTTYVQVHSGNVKKVIGDLRHIYASGCTDFGCMFMMLDKICNLYPSDDFVIYVFSDGKHEPGRRDGILYERMSNQFKNTLSSRRGKSWVKTRAFSNDVDIKLMDALTRYGSEQGDFQYAFSADEIITMLDTDNMLLVQTDNGVLHIGETSINLVFCEDVKGSYTAQTIIDVRDITSIGKMSLTIANSKDPIEVKFEPIPDDKDHVIEYIDAALFVFSEQLKKISGDIVQASGNRRSVEVYINKIRELDTISEKFYQTRYSKINNRLIRKSYAFKYNEFRQVFNEVQTTAIQLLRGTTTQSMARILNAGFSAVRKGMQRRIGVLAANGITRLEESDKALMNMKFEEKQVRTELESSSIRCMISLSGPADAILDTDILCMTGHMSRPESAIASSDQIRIARLNSIESTLLWSIFSDELLKGLDQVQDIDRAKRIHNGFDIGNRIVSVNSSGVMSDAYRGKLNFAYPMYIHSSHWNVAKHYLPRIVAWMSTLDFAAQSFEQIKSVPFVLVGSAIWEYTINPSEHNLQMFMNVFRVAWQVCIDYNLQHIHEDLNTWYDSQTGRVPKNISSLVVFMTKLIFTCVRFKENSVGDLIQLDRNFWISILEEHVRRVLSKNPIIDDSFVAIECNYKNFIDIGSTVQLDPIEYARKIDPTAVIKEAKELYTPPVFEEKDLVLDSPNITNILQRILTSCNDLNHIQAMYHFYEFFRTVDRIKLIYELDSNLGIVNDNISKMFKDFRAFQRRTQNEPIEIPFGLSQLEFYRMSVNAARLYDNIERAKSTVTYLDGNSILTDAVARCIQSETSRQKNRHTANINIAKAKLFAKTSDIRVAMGVVSTCANNGDHPFQYMLKELQKLQDIPLRDEKIKMLVDGVFDGVQLYRKGFRYPANKRNRKRLIAASEHQRAHEGKEFISIEEWNGIFKWTKNNFNYQDMCYNHEVA